MADYSQALRIIREHEGFNEKAYPCFHTGGEPYTIGYGTQFYPDGTPVKLGQRVSQEKALEYLKHELDIIWEQIDSLDLCMSLSTRNSLVSFIHSVGWENFLYSEIPDNLDNGDWLAAASQMQKWVFDHDRQLVGGLLDRRAAEVQLLMQDTGSPRGVPGDILLAAFRNYTGSPAQVRAIRRLEISLNPYVLSEFGNEYRVFENPWRYYPGDYVSLPEE